MPYFVKNHMQCTSLTDWDKKQVSIVKLLADPDDNSIIDAEAMPQYLVKMDGTDATQSVYIDELVDENGSEVVTPEMKAVIDGQNAFAFKAQNPYSGELATFFDFGLALAEIKDLN